MNATVATTLAQGLDAIVQTNAPLAAHTWFGVGGNADMLVQPKSEDALRELVRRCAMENLPVRVLGSGANLLVLQEGVDGVVVKLDQPAFTQWTLRPDRDANCVLAPAGVNVLKLLNECVREGLDGMCQMAGIPASMGGATRMNAGGKYGCIGDAIESVATMNSRGEITVHPRNAIQFSYRHSSLPQELILWTLLALTPEDPEYLRTKTLEIYKYKKNSQPLAENSAGCLFINPIDFTHGSAFVSPEHANFVCVQKNGRANDVLELARIIQDRVRESQGVQIEMEVSVWGRSFEPKEKN